MRFVTGGYVTAMRFFENRVRQMLALPIDPNDTPVENAGCEHFALYADAPIADIVRMYGPGGQVESMKQLVRGEDEMWSSLVRSGEGEREGRIRRALLAMLDRIEDEPSVALSSKRVWV